jgi:hypothetical protein
MGRTARAPPPRPVPDQGPGRLPARIRCCEDRRRSGRVPPSRPVPGPGRPPARIRCCGLPDPAVLDRPPSPVPAPPATIRCSWGPGCTAPARPPSPHRPPSPARPRGQRDRPDPPPARTRRCAGAGRSHRPPPGSAGRGPVRTGPARIDPARIDPARTAPGRPVIRTGPDPAARAARSRWHGTSPGRRPGTARRTSAAGAQTPAGQGQHAPSAARVAAVGSGRPGVARVRNGRPPRRTGRVPGLPSRPRAAAGSPALAAPPVCSGRAGPHPDRTADRAARPGQPGRPAPGRGRRGAGHPAAGRNPLRQRRTPAAAGRGEGSGNRWGEPDARST